MKHSSYKYLIVLLALAAVSCKKWKDPSPLIIEDLNQNQYNNADYKAYLEHLKIYKQSKHPILVAVVANWDVTAFSNKLTTLPDSLDMIALSSPPIALSDSQSADIKTVQSQKGTKVLFYLNAQKMSDSIKNNPTLFTGGDSASIATYVGKVADQVTKGGYDGIVLNMEGNVCYTCNTVFTSAAKTSYLISLLGKIAGPSSSTAKLLFVQGEPKDVGAANGTYFNYFIANTSTSSYYYVEDAAYDLYKNFSNFGADKFIVTADFSEIAKAKVGGIPFYITSGGVSQASSLGLAGWNTADGKKGGLMIYADENDFGNSFFSYTRGAISIQNPPIK